MHILGISCFYHDAAAALLRDGVLVAAAEEERFSRVKHDFGYPALAAEFCMRKAGIRAGDLDYVVFYEKPFLKFERILLTVLQTYPRSLKVFREAMINWFGDKLWVKGIIHKRLGVPLEKILFVEHHLSHAASAYFVSPFEEAAVLTVDGVGEWTTTTLGRARGNELILENEQRFPHSLGLLYSAFTAYLGFEVNEGEYKVMGMAPYGQPKYVEEVWKTVQRHGEGAFSLDMDYFAFHRSTTQSFSPKLVELLGPPRRPDSKFFTRSSGYPSYYGPKPPDFESACRLNEHYADVAASIQRVTEELILDMAKELHRRTGLDRLCMAGGVALNSVANGRLLRESGFKEIYIQPAAGDGGGALGAALYVHNAVLGLPRSPVMGHAYWGEEYGPAEAAGQLREAGAQWEEIGDEEKLLERVVDRLLRGEVVGWHQGRFEWGPRALGNRSILANPAREEMKEIVNTKIKFREPFRPFAPSVLAERAGEFFELKEPERHYPARFMLLVAPVREEKRDVIPATTHVDGTGRLQTVFRETNPLYYRLIERFGAVSGIPVVLNTSFNLRGEPIVNTPANSFRTFMASEMDALVIGNFLLSKNGL
ncbi:MAG: carbamoyltransferase [Candidatus Tectomicrobia bacterium]|uniref:Carbamoyltransferase n=1 Tax=Tectimicrobiota bacterium TaxID=2528274 RepID=A0A932HX63_UNCTE|nr:carbamoyltransferase [Candidatus Tectomicrobia bacterium]